VAKEGNHSQKIFLGLLKKHITVGKHLLGKKKRKNAWTKKKKNVDWERSTNLHRLRRGGKKVIRRKIISCPQKGEIRETVLRPI